MGTSTQDQRQRQPALWCNITHMQAQQFGNRQKTQSKVYKNAATEKKKHQKTIKKKIIEFLSGAAQTQICVFEMHSMVRKSEIKTCSRTRIIMGCCAAEQSFQTQSMCGKSYKSLQQASHQYE